MSRVNTDEENIPCFPKDPPKEIKFKKSNEPHKLVRNLISYTGNFHQYFQHNGSPTSYSYSKIISENGVKVAQDVHDTLLKLPMATEFFDVDGQIDFCTTLKLNVYSYSYPLTTLSEYKREYGCLPQTRDQYMCIKGMLSGLEFLHNNGFVHGCLNFDSFWAVEVDYIINVARTFKIVDIDLFTRWNKNKYFDKLEKSNNKLKNIYETRLRKSFKNTGFCSLKQHTKNQITIKDNVESWYYICVYMFENIIEWKDNLNDDDIMYVMKQNMRKPSYFGYENISTRFTEIIYLLDRMDDDNVDYKLIKEKIVSASEHPLPKEDLLLKVNSSTEISDFLKLACESRLRKPNVNFKILEQLRREIEKAEKKNFKPEVYHTKCGKSYEESPDSMLSEYIPPKSSANNVDLKIDTTSMITYKSPNNASCSKNLNDNGTSDINKKKEKKDVEVLDANKNKEKNVSEILNNKKKVETNANEPSIKKIKGNDKKYLTSIKRTFKKLFKK
uniref:SCP domain-containing protein n=1 Tax=Strongyloides stercoralis TaxID=6248 RepID=A0AAF5I0V2_STRER